MTSLHVPGEHGGGGLLLTTYYLLLTTYYSQESMGAEANPNPNPNPTPTPNQVSVVDTSVILEKLAHAAGEVSSKQ